MRNRRVYLIGLSLLVIFIISVKGYSHPHVFVDHSIQVEMDSDGLKGFTCYWELDEMFSSMIFSDYDQNRDGKFSASEIQAVETGAFDNLANFDYFTHVYVDDVAYAIGTARDFTVQVSGDRVIYRFFIPVDVEAKSKAQEVVYTVYDDSYYVSFEFLQKDTVIESSAGIDYTDDTGTDQFSTDLYGDIYAEQFIFRFWED